MFNSKKPLTEAGIKILDEKRNIRYLLKAPKKTSTESLNYFHWITMNYIYKYIYIYNIHTHTHCFPACWGAGGFKHGPGKKNTNTKLAKVFWTKRKLGSRKLQEKSDLFRFHGGAGIYIYICVFFFSWQIQQLKPQKDDLFYKSSQDGNLDVIKSPILCEETRCPNHRAGRTPEHSPEKNHFSMETVLTIPVLSLFVFP